MMNSAGTAVLRARNSAVLPWIVLGVGMLASYLLFSTVKDNIESSALERFDHQTIEAKRVIETRIQSYADVLYSVRALFDTDASVSRAEFHRFVESLNLKNRFPGIEVVNYAIHVPAEDKRRFEEGVRRDTSLEAGGYPRFAIKPPGERPEYHVLVYLEPMTDNEFALGLDLSQQPSIQLATLEN
jgi:two-component system, sensor histidine kinase and response regulator